MNHIKTMEKRNATDIGYTKDNIVPYKKGIDKTMTLEQVIQLAYEIDANIIVKAGKNAKWYLKKFDPCQIEDKIDETVNGWRADNVRRCTTWIIEWDDV